VELDWPAGPPQSPRPLRVGVLVEGTSSGVAERAKQMSELLEAAGGSAGVSQTAPARWGVLPSAMSSRGGLGGSSPRANTVIRVSFWVSALGSVLEALAAAGASAGVRPAVTGPAGAGALYACLAPLPPQDPAAEDEAGVRFVTALRERLSGAAGSAGPRGSVAVLAAPPAVLAAARDATVPGSDLMRAVKDQFDPGHRMFPGRLAVLAPRTPLERGN
jgi:glycolate oxidase FAD binding subunit